MNIKKKMSNKSIRGVIWHDIARGFYADRFRYLIAVLMLAGVLIILGNHEFGMMDTAAHVVALVSANIVMVQVNIKKRFNNHE